MGSRLSTSDPITLASPWPSVSPVPAAIQESGSAIVGGAVPLGDPSSDLSCQFVGRSGGFAELLCSSSSPVTGPANEVQ
jgi:hypothetical protein